MDFIAGILELTGIWVIGSKHRTGFILNLLGGLTWIGYVLMTGHAKGLLIVVIPALMINLRNFVKWGES